MASNVGRAGLRAEDSVEIHGCVVDATRPGEAWERLVAYSAHRYPASALNDGGDGAPPGKVRWVFLSDTCGLHHAMADVPNGDVLVHCGNFSTTGSVERTREFVEWFAGHPHRRKVLVAGNHDTSLDADFYDAHWQRLHPTRRDDAALREALRSDGRFAYLEHASGDDGRHYSKWATQVFRAAPPPAVQDWGWPKFASHAELQSLSLIHI